MWASALALALALPGTARADHVSLFPDLKMMKPTSVAATKKRLRFGILIANRGRGPFEVRVGEKQLPCETGSGFYAPQIVYADANHDGVYDPGVDTDLDDVDDERSCIRFHAAHDHFHYAGFSRYALRRIRDGEPRREVSTSRKASFCLQDTDLVFPQFAGDSTTWTCVDSAPGSRMGISVGWGDHYTAGTSGQSLRIAGLRRGRYCLVTRVDPVRKIVERPRVQGARAAPNLYKQKLLLNPSRSKVRRLRGGC